MSTKKIRLHRRLEYIRTLKQHHVQALPKLATTTNETQ